MTTMGMRVIRAGHDTPNTSNIASKKNPRGRRCGVSLRIKKNSNGFVGDVSSFCSLNKSSPAA